MSHPRNLGYWIPTALVALNWTFGGVGSLLRADSSMEVFRTLGYPDYFATILGVAQLLGVVAILAPVPRTLREWAYAGFTFDVLAAIASLLATGKSVLNFGFPAVALVMVLVSHRAWHRRAPEDLVNPALSPG